MVSFFSLLVNYLLQFKIKLTSSDAVLQGSLIEDVGREATELGMHPVLDLQSDWSDPQHHQPLKQGLRQAGAGSFLTHHYRAQLAVVTNKDHLKWK